MSYEADDRTMRSILGVHRSEVNELEERVQSLEYSLGSTDYDKRQALDKVTRLDRANDNLRTTVREHVEKAEKLQGVIDALKLELGSERLVHSVLRDAVRDNRSHLEAVLTELVTGGDLTPSGKAVLSRIMGFNS